MRERDRDREGVTEIERARERERERERKRPHCTGTQGREGDELLPTLQIMLSLFLSLTL